MGKGKRNRMKRNIEKQKQATNNMQEKVVIAYYKLHPVEFVEEHLGVKLKFYQKWLLKLAFRGVK